MHSTASNSRRSLSNADARARLETLVSQTRIKDHVGDLPPVAFPTIALAAACVMFQAVTVHAAFTGALSMRFASSLCSFITYLAFTPMHDACHGSVATEPSLRFLNNVVGTTCGALFPCPFPAFKRMHLLHHKHTNEEHLDPDGWVAKGPFFLLPLRWITIEVSYYSRFDQHPLSSSLLLFTKLLFRYIPEIFAGRRPRSEALQSSSLHCVAFPRIQTLASP